MYPKFDKLDKWEDVISSVEKEHIPIDCVKKIILKLKHNRQKTINLDSLRKNGLDIEEIEMVISRTMSELGPTISNVNFVINVSTVAGHIQPITDRLLEGL
jgi:hypothetical protein